VGTVKKPSSSLLPGDRLRRLIIYIILLYIYVHLKYNNNIKKNTYINCTSKLMVLSLVGLCTIFQTFLRALGQYKYNNNNIILYILWYKDRQSCAQTRQTEGTCMTLSLESISHFYVQGDSASTLLPWLTLPLHYLQF